MTEHTDDKSVVPTEDSQYVMLTVSPILNPRETRGCRGSDSPIVRSPGEGPDGHNGKNSRGRTDPDPGHASRVTDGN